MKRSLILGLGAALTLTTVAFAADQSGRMKPDADANGRLTQAEQQAASRARFARLDADKDGRVTREELQASRGERRSERMEARRARMADPAVRAQRLDQRFARLDADNSGQISKAEFAAGADRMHAMRGERGGHHRGRRGGKAPGMAGGMFDRLDRDKDGAVTAAEMDFAAAERFSMLDGNRDGVVTRDERRQHREARRALRDQAPATK